jgi:hypothetical protein
MQGMMIEMDKAKLQTVAPDFWKGRAMLPNSEITASPIKIRYSATY